MPRLSQQDFADVERVQRHFQDYTLLISRGRGAQGAVYSALSGRTGRRVALKLLDSALATRRQRERFLREIDLISSLRHPHIVTVYDYDVVDDHPFYAMDLVCGLDIHEHVAAYGLDVRETVALFLKVCDAVDHAHRNGVIHRDLKPSNILVDEHGCPFVVDFGLAKSLTDGAAGLTEACVVVGTIPYMSPEQSLGAEADALSDVYALGVILYQMLTDSLPWNLDGPRDVVLGRMRHDPPRPLADALRHDPRRLRQIGQDLRMIVLKALAKDPQQRYRSVAGMAEDLRRCLNGAAVEARAGHALYVLRKALRRNGGALTVVAVLLAAAGIAWWAHLRVQTVSQQARDGLHMGGLLKLASSARDDGRVAEAVSLFQAVIDLGGSTPYPAPAVRESLFDARLRLAELLISEGDHAAAEAHCQAALDIARQTLQDHPTDAVWQRYLGFALRARARLLMYTGRLEAAIASASSCSDLRRRLSTAHPQNVSMQVELATAEGTLGQCYRRAGQHAEARGPLWRSFEILQALHLADPANPDHTVELAFAQQRLANWHFAQRTCTGDRAALEIYDSALDTAGLPAVGGRAWELAALIRAVQDNIEALQRRGLCGAAPPHELLNSSGGAAAVGASLAPAPVSAEAPPACPGSATPSERS